ncbi:erythromycin esterase family protein [Actinocorallia sp. B10E7]|uniref:erythromycin esterase family protein n=1 Tax=Actinocorallia sp. B10E7 TaxID=3153558 RepID=UPI00325E9B0B
MDQKDVLSADHGGTRGAHELFESALSADGLGDYFLDLHAERPPAVAELLGRTAKFRAIGLVYDPDNDAAHHMTGGSPAEWFDVIAHYRHVTPARPLD